MRPASGRGVAPAIVGVARMLWPLVRFVYGSCEKAVLLQELLEGLVAVAASAAAVLLPFTATTIKLALVRWPRALPCHTRSQFGCSFRGAWPES